MGLLSSTNMFGCVPSGVPLWRYSHSYPSNRWRKERWFSSQQKGLGVHIQANFWWKLRNVNSAKCTKLLKAFQSTVERMMEEDVMCHCEIIAEFLSVLGKKRGSNNMLDHVYMSDMNTVNSNQWCILCCVTSNQPVSLQPLSFKQIEGSVIQMQWNWARVTDV